jgi:hypothetical protein
MGRQLITQPIDQTESPINSLRKAVNHYFKLTQIPLEFVDVKRLRFCNEGYEKVVSSLVHLQILVKEAESPR